MRLTRRGLAVLVAAVVLLVLGQVAGYPLLLALAAAGFGAVVAALVLTVRRPRVEVVREVYPDRVERGRPAVLALHVHNPGQRRQAGFQAVDKFAGDHLTMNVRSLAPGARPVYQNELPTSRRGRHTIGPLTLNRTDALGLSRSRLSLGDTATLWVYPRTHPVRVIPGGWLRHHHEGPAGEMRGSLDLREVREYVPGDEVRHLHWKATARTGRLMIRDYVDPNQPRFTVLLDNRSSVLFEDAVEVVASLAVATAKADHRCRLVTSGGVDVTAPAGVLGVRRLQDELCVVDANASGVSLVPPGFAGGGSLVVVTPVLSPADRSALAAVRSGFGDVVVIGLGVAGDVPGATVIRAANAADAVQRWQGVVSR